MATATFSHSSQYRTVNQNLLPSEFGGPNTKDAPNPTDWDEEIVPALKKRLEADRMDLEKRISTTDFHHARMQSTKPRPIARRNANDEILQDGLGDDELIPSEWATGSKARFLTANRNNHPAYTISRSASDMYMFDRSPDEYQDNHDSYATAFDMHAPNSPPLQDGVNSGPDMVANARERARKLARERQRVATEMEGQESSKQGFSTEKGKVTDGIRMRTKSTPGLGRRYDQEAVESRYVAENLGKGTNSRNQSPSDGRRTPSSKIPLPISGSMSRVANSPRTIPGKQNTIQPSEMAEGDAGFLDQANYDDSPRPDDHQKQPLADISNQSTRSTPSKKKTKAHTITRRTPSGKGIQNSPPTQDVLDEFGPLGGTPRKTMDTSVGEFGDISRASSNPWDEELLPTVKRRLAQEALLNDPRLSKVDGLVDAWDRNGIPISTRAVSASSSRTNGLRQMSFEQSGVIANDMQKSGEEDLGKNEMKLDGKKKGELFTKDQSTEKIPQPQQQQQQQQQEVLRMKRLTDQLDLGFQTEDVQGQLNEIEMRNIQANQGDRTKSNLHKENDSHNLHDPSMPTLTQSQQLSQKTNKVDHQKANNKPIRQQEEQKGAGCCQCLIM